jgi:hypothetical protein
VVDREYFHSSYHARGVRTLIPFLSNHILLKNLLSLFTHIFSFEFGATFSYQSYRITTGMSIDTMNVQPPKRSSDESGYFFVIGLLFIFAE